jgi:transcription elongation factor GreA
VISLPLGAAILGLKIGEKTTYEAPNGKEITVSISAVETYTGS